MKNENSKIIKIERAYSFTHEANVELKEWFGQSARGVGSYFKKSSKKPGSGLSFNEEVLLMPHIINLPAEDRDFRKQVELFFTEITTKIPADGLILDIGLIDNSKELGEKLENGVINLPLEIEDYVRYRHAISHPQVAENEFEANGNQLIYFYIKDNKFTSQKKADENDIRDKALALYLNIKEKSQTVEMVLVNMGVNVKDVENSDRILKLKEKVESKQIEVVEDFIKVVSDKDLEIKWKLNRMIQANILTKVGSRILVKESGVEIGRDMKETILWWEDKKNSDEVGVLVARYKELAVK